MLIVWLIVFVAALAVLVKGADWLLTSAEKIGLAMGLSPFIVGVTIVGVGTSFPELISSLISVFKGVVEIPVANVIGSNIFNILVIVGLSAILARKLVVTKSLIDLDLPLLSISTVILLGVCWDKQINFMEALLLLVLFCVYLLYTILHKDDHQSEEIYEMLPARPERRQLLTITGKNKVKKPKLALKDFLILLVGLAGLYFGARYLIDAVVNLATILDIAPGVIAIIAIAAGTSLPEVIVAVKAAINKKSEIALGNIFGSNVFNALVVVGLPGLFRNLTLDDQTFAIGLPALALTTLLFVISGISRRIHIWEGFMYLGMYLLFIGKIFKWF